MGNVTDIFPKRLRELRGGENQQTIADALKISRVSLGYYENGDRKPDIEILERISSYYNVSCDYLIGKTSVKELNLDYQKIEEITGLNAGAIHALNELYQDSQKEPTDNLDSANKHALITIESINVLINEKNTLNVLANYLFTNITHFYDDYTYINEKMFSPIDEVGLWDETLGLDMSIDSDIISNLLLSEVQKLLPELRKKCLEAMPESLKRPKEETSDDLFEHLDSLTEVCDGQLAILEAAKDFARKHGIDIDSLIENSDNSDN